MENEVIERLLALNRAFYTTFARSFSDTRPASDPTLACILPHILQRARILDVGCGNGRLALLLEQERPGAVYFGIDAIPELLKLAQTQLESLMSISAKLQVIDVGKPGWSKDLCNSPSSASSEAALFDCIVILAVLHHIPSLDLRTQVLREAAALLKPEGHLVISTWQFLDSERQRRKLVDWAEVSIAQESLEPGDYLLDWKREGRGLRYCHLVDKDEIIHMASASGLRLQQTFRAGGREGNLSLYAILNRDILDREQSKTG